VTVPSGIVVGIAASGTVHITSSYSVGGPVQVTPPPASQIRQTSTP
jgi:hypothetical protein